MSSAEVLAIGIGVLLALPYIWRASRSRGATRMYAVGLIVAAAVYVGFALFAGDRQVLLREGAGLLIFTAIALIGMRVSAYLLAAGWAAHVAWDLLFHSIEAAAYVPWWYPVVCIGFDLMVAGAILGRIWSRGE
jgi:hypothetical protein